NDGPRRWKLPPLAQRLARHLKSVFTLTDLHPIAIAIEPRDRAVAGGHASRSIRNPLLFLGRVIGPQVRKAGSAQRPHSWPPSLLTRWSNSYSSTSTASGRDR